MPELLSYWLWSVRRRTIALALAALAALSFSDITTSSGMGGQISKGRNLGPVDDERQVYAVIPITRRLYLG